MADQIHVCRCPPPPKPPSPDDGPVSQQLNAIGYLREKRIPQILESLMAGLMVECPDDHLTYMEDKLDMMKDIGVENIDWDVFIVHLHPTRDPNYVELVNESEYFESKKGYRHVSDSELYPLTESTTEINPGHTNIIHRLTEYSSEDLC